MVNASPDVSRAVHNAALLGVSVDVLRRVRNAFPYLAVLFRDKNNDPDIDFGVDIETLRGLMTIVTVETAALGDHSHPKPHSSVAVLDLMDTFGLERGLIETVHPCEYLYIASKQPFDADVITGALTQARDEGDLVKRLLASYPVVLLPGADNDYIGVLASDPKIFSSCRLTRAE